MTAQIVISQAALQHLLSRIKEVAAQTSITDDEEFNAYDHCGGNYDDAFEAGMTEGATLFAQELQEFLDEMDPHD